MSKKIQSDKKSSGKSSVKEIVNRIKGVKLLGEVCTFNARTNKKHTHQNVVDALTKAGLDPNYAKKLVPRAAFSRACKKLHEDLVIDVLKDGEELIKFQFTKKMMKNEEWTYSKDTEVTLNKKTGQLECNRKELQQRAQALLDEAMELRTTSDITNTIQLLFEKNADIFSLRDQGGCFFVPQENVEFLIKVEEFLNNLGGYVGRFPVPEGTTQGNNSVKNSVADAFNKLLLDHEQAIDLFSISTRTGTMEAMASKINETRVNIEAYGHYLNEKSKELFKHVEEAKKKLKDKIDQLSKDKETTKNVDDILGCPISAILKWMGTQDWEFDEAKTVLNHYGAIVADTTIRGQLWCGKTGRYGSPAELNDKQQKELESLRKKLAKAA